MKKKQFYGNLNAIGIHYTAYVKELDEDDFPTLIKNRFHIPQTTGITREQYHKLPKAQRNVKKGVSGCVFAAMFSDVKKQLVKRADQPVSGISLLTIDIDTNGLEFSKRLHLLGSQIGEYNYIVYHTASSTPSEPRFRVIIDADLKPGDYVEGLRRASALLGLHVEDLDKASESYRQAMFLPVVFDGDVRSPIVASYLDGRAFDSRDLPEMDAVDGVSKAKSPADAQAAMKSADLKQLLQLPMSGIEDDRILKALEHISPDCEYSDWLRVAMGLKHQFMRDDERGFRIFDAWSSGAKRKDYSAETCRLKWNQIAVSPRQRGHPITIRTVFHYAIANGWENTMLSDEIVGDFKEWVIKAEDWPTLSNCVAMKIASVSSLLTSAMMEEDMVSSFLEHAKGFHKKTVSKSALRKDIENYKRKINAMNFSTTDDDHLWAKMFVYVESLNIFTRTDTGEDLKPETVNHSHERDLMTKKPSAKDGIPSEDVRPSISPVKFLMNVLLIPRVYRKMYNPTTTERLFTIDRSNYLNTYRPTYPVPDLPGASRARDIIEGHIRRILDRECADILLSWMAFIVQNPGVKIRWAILLQGAQGCGKTYLQHVMSAALGEEHVRSLDLSVIGKGWTDWAEGRQLTVIEEVKVSGENKWMTMDVLKAPITNDTIAIARRNTDAYQIPNYTNYIMFTNHRDALPIDENERRYCVMKSLYQTKAEVLRDFDDYYFSTLFNFTKDHPGAVRAFLLNYPVAIGFSANHVPNTGHLKAMQNDSKRPEVLFIESMLKDPRVPMITRELICLDALTYEMDDNGYSTYSRRGSAGLHYILQDMGYDMKVVKNADQSPQTVYVPYSSGLTDRQVQIIYDNKKEFGFDNDFLN
jgi:hypothetical protein